MTPKRPRLAPRRITGHVDRVVQIRVEPTRALDRKQVAVHAALSWLLLAVPDRAARAVLRSYFNSLESV